MARPRKRYRLWKTKPSGIYYYKLPGMRGWRSTGCRSKTAAESFCIDKLKDWIPPAAAPPRSGRLRDLLEPYFLWDSCPRIADRQLEGKRIGRQHAARQRSLIDLYVFTDPIADMLTRGLTVGEVKAFRLRLTAKSGPRTVNAVLTALKTVFNDALDRGTIKENPFKSVGKISYKKREAGIFTAGELAELFPVEDLGPWEDVQDYTAFLIAATCGLRRGEILALHWGDLDFDAQVLHVRQAWKDDTELGEPKWGQVRDVPLPDRTIQKIKELRAASLYLLPGALVFHNVDGSRKGTNWWTARFNKAMFKAKIQRVSRGLKPHSFRHTLNTILRDRGIPDEKIRATMGWSNPKTQDGYTHYQIEHLRGQADLIDGLFS